MGSDLRFLRRKGWGCNNMRLGYGRWGRSVSGGSYVLSVFAEVTLCSGEAFGNFSADKSGGETCPFGEETSGDGGGPG